MKMRKSYVLWILVLVLLPGAVYFLRFRQPDLPASPASPSESTPPSETEIAARNLITPWELIFLPDGDMLITERPGTVTRVGGINTQYPIEGVEAIGEGGLLGMALHPDFQKNGWIYLYLTSKNEGQLVNRVERYHFGQDGFSDRFVIMDSIPAGRYHNGGRIAFGPDGYLYVTTGDSGNSDLAQNKNSVAGKILRLTDSGQAPADNPFGNAVWSYGHRNPQGLAWDDSGRLWATEHGRSGVLSGLDELNLIEKGQNYGWPEIQGDETHEGMRTPILHSGPSTTWAPTAIVYWNDRLFFGGLRGQALYEADISEDQKIARFSATLQKQLGRIRIVRLGTDGLLYIGTSNTDGRGEPQADDDKIIKLNPQSLSNETVIQ